MMPRPNRAERVVPVHAEPEPSTGGAVVLTGQEVASLLRVSKRTVERLHLPSIKLGRTRRYLRDDVLSFLREKAV